MTDVLLNTLEGGLGLIVGVILGKTMDYFTRIGPMLTKNKDNMTPMEKVLLLTAVTLINCFMILLMTNVMPNLFLNTSFVFTFQFFYYVTQEQAGKLLKSIALPEPVPSEDEKSKTK